MDDTYELNLTNVAGWIASGAMIFGAVVPYVPQYKEIKRKEDAEGFSLYVCLTLLIANTLRILFWFGKHYEFPLLLQSILMILAMFVMIKLCINVQNRTQIIKSKERVLTARFVYFTDLDARFFWKWTDFRSYLGFMLLFAGVGGVMTYLFLDIPIFIEILGFLAVLIEAMLGIPQFLRNSTNKSTVGMSHGGDVDHGRYLQNMLFCFEGYPCAISSVWCHSSYNRHCYFSTSVPLQD
ncbi:solute carrier family 66 member 2 isoform X3 [Solenopsis invicta]|uniref:solute carrier family 66 member 2 isoform X3 n=1 Tax=Solenopsis invicta TaxID=13686 RepID=UPI00193E6E3C|nr:solute carrier family 66 member 2 isoform X3 [Solenopsis invicta]